MENDPILRDLMSQASAHVAALIREAYERGRKAAEEDARDKVLALFGGTRRETAPVMRPRVRTDDDNLPVGADVARPLRNTLVQMAIGENGVSPGEITDYLHRWPGTQWLTEVQVRGGLKNLVKRGDCIRVARGKYRPSERLITESRPRESETPSEDQSLDAPKSNGAVPLRI